MSLFRGHWAGILLFLVILLGAFFRFYQLADIPYGLFPDESVNGINALQVIHSGEIKLFYPENNGREGLFINIQAISVWLFGANVWALRLVSAVFGTLAIWGIYLAAKETLLLFLSRGTKSNQSYFAKYVNSETTIVSISLLAAFFTSASFWHINFSRIGFRAIMLPFMASFAVYWLLKSLRTGGLISAALAGTFAGLGLHTYIAFRFVPFFLSVPLVNYTWLWLKNRELYRRIPLAILTFLILAFLAAAPMLIYFYQNPSDFTGRTSDVSIMTADSPLLEFIKSNILTLVMFNIWGDCNARHNYDCRSQLLWPVGLAFIAGIYFMADSFRKESSAVNMPFVLLAVWFGVMTLPATLTREGLPHALRSIGLIPPVMITAGLGAWTAYRIAAKNHETLSRIVLWAGIIFVTLFGYYSYFHQFADSAKTKAGFRFDLTEIADAVASLPKSADKYVIANYPNLPYGMPIEANVVQFLTDTAGAEEQNAKNLHYILAQDLPRLEIADTAKKQVIFIPLNQENASSIAAELEARFPNLKLQTQKTAGGITVLSN